MGRTAYQVAVNQIRSLFNLTVQKYQEIHMGSFLKILRKGLSKNETKDRLVRGRKKKKDHKSLKLYKNENSLPHSFLLLSIILIFKKSNGQILVCSEVPFF